jgi:hypothetical protein
MSWLVAVSMNAASDASAVISAMLRSVPVVPT